MNRMVRTPDPTIEGSTVPLPGRSGFAFVVVFVAAELEEDFFLHYARRGEIAGELH